MNELATATQPKPPIVVLRERLLARREELKAALTDISPEAFIRALMTSVAINPDILACSWNSVWLSCMRACREGLLPDGVEGAMVPFKGTCSFIPMYQGLLRRFRRSGQFRWVTAGIVRQGELFQHFIDETGEHIKHVPGDSFDAPIVRVYGMAHTKDGAVFVAVLPIAEANKIKAMSKATREDAPWRMWPEEMYKKTALRRLTKLLPTARDIVPPSFDEDDGLSETAAAFLDQPASGADATVPPPQEQPPQSSAPAGDVGKTLDQFSRAEAKAAATDEAIARAYELGKQHKADGHLRKAVPGEYREASATALAAAWLKGWDGAPL